MVPRHRIRPTKNHLEALLPLSCAVDDRGGGIMSACRIYLKALCSGDGHEEFKAKKQAGWFSFKLVAT